MKKFFALFVAIISMNASALILFPCYNYASPNNAVSYSYQSCINSNFNSIEREVNAPIFLQYCSNFGSGVDYSFTSCINNNFRSVERALSRPIFLSNCMNFSNTDLDFSFSSCVNNNFRSVERGI
jgi:hypothetical protein